MTNLVFTTNQKLLSKEAVKIVLNQVVGSWPMFTFALPHLKLATLSDFGLMFILNFVLYNFYIESLRLFAFRKAFLHF